MPFGIQVKGFVIGILFAMFVLPYIQMLFSGVTNRTPKAA